MPSALAVLGCGKRDPSVVALGSDARVLALGDSLTVGYGAAPEEAWPALLAQATGWRVDNEPTPEPLRATLGSLGDAEFYQVVAKAE